MAGARAPDETGELARVAGNGCAAFDVHAAAAAHASAIRVGGARRLGRRVRNRARPPPGSPRASHVLEQPRIRAAHGQHVAVAAQMDAQAPEQVALDPVDRRVRDDHAAMHPREAIGIEPLQQSLSGVRITCRSPAVTTSVYLSSA